MTNSSLNDSKGDVNEETFSLVKVWSNADPPLVLLNQSPIQPIVSNYASLNDDALGTDVKTELNDTCKYKN